ncbi:MAG TPA: hypothetical protein VFV58_28030 [Blastocatellia bacterium]|jgi:hypothetical protein|nr:hypothetical protein [Blastocatellia bacterium]
MGLDLRKLEDLKEKMQVEEDFGAIWKFFFDHFGENPEFMALGARADETMHLFLEPILENICKQLVNREVMAAQFILTELPDQKFYHGPCLTDAGIAVVFYFEDLKMGMFSLTPGLGSGLVHYGRFSTIPVTDKVPFLLQSKNNTSH